MAQSNTTLVYISYAHSDLDWLERILEYLKPAAERNHFEIWFDKKLKVGDDWKKKLEDMRRQATAAILLVSQAAVQSEYVRPIEWNHLRELYNEGQIKLFPIAVDRFDWNALEQIADIQFFPERGRPLADFDEAQLDQELKKFADIVADKVRPVEDRHLPEYSETVQICLKNAFRYLADDTAKISSIELLLGCLLHGRDTTQDDSAHFLWEQLIERSQLPENEEPNPETLIRMTDRTFRTDVTGVPDANKFDDDGRAAMNRASSIMSRTKTNTVLSTRNLVAALMVPFNPQPAVASATLLSSLFGNLAWLLTGLFKRIAKIHPSDDLQAWKNILIPEDEPPEAWSTTIVGYSADDGRSTDRLNIQPDVNTLCAVIMAKDWTPPLSIGLFGDWGTGKSFFMKKMKAQIRQLAEHSQKVAPEETEFVPYIAQIEFNAWHYVDTNLWASLITRIFEGLSEEIFHRRPPSLEDPYEKTKRELFKDLESTKIQVQEAEQALILANDAVVEATTEYETQKSELENSQSKISSLQYLKDEDWKEIVDHDPELKAALDEVADHLQLGSAMETIARVREFAAETEKTWGRLKKLWQWTSANKKARIIAVITVIFILFILFMPSQWRANLGDWAKGIGMYVTALATFVGGLLTTLQPHLKRLSRAMDLAEAACQLSDKAVLRQETELRVDLSRKEEILQQAEEKLERKRAEKAKIDRQIEGIRAGRYLEDFLHERVASTEYTEQMGIIAMIRQDFERLTNRLKQGVVLKPENESTDAKEIKIDRVILYIDDLDRCPPKRVVDVLQAVHLILSIELFVVIAAVDPRWLLNALRYHYQELFRSKSEKLDVSEEEEAAWTSTPYNYLEKIFQIPFTLRAMSESGYTDLVMSFFDPIPAEKLEVRAPWSTKIPSSGEETADREGSYDEPPPEGMAGHEDTSETEMGDQDNNGADTSPTEKEKQGAVKDDEESTEQVAGENQADDKDQKNRETEEDEKPPDLKPEGLNLSPTEKEMLSLMRPLISTPRSAKRMVNIYRLLRASLSDRELNQFAGDESINREYASVQILLGILVGYPGMASDVFRELRTTKSRSFSQFRISLLPKSKSNSTRMENAVRKDMDLVEAQSWKEFCESLDRLDDFFAENASDELKKDLNTSESIATYKKWLERVARYSFRTGHVVSTLARRGVELFQQEDVIM